MWDDDILGAFDARTLDSRGAMQLGRVLCWNYGAVDWAVDVGLGNPRSMGIRPTEHFRNPGSRNNDIFDDPRPMAGAIVVLLN